MMIGMTTSTSTLFCEFIKTIRVQNSAEISQSYRQITQALNQKYYGSDSETTHCRQIGSYGRGTAIHGVSDLDMAFELPKEVYDRFHAYTSSGQSALLQEIKKVIQDLYPEKNKDSIRGDGQIVGIPFDEFDVEVLPTFFLTKDQTGNIDFNIYTFPDTNDGGRWRLTKPKLEIAASDEMSKNTNRNYKMLCRMVRAWRNTHGLGCGGLWIDTLCYNFFNQTTAYNNVGFGEFGLLVKDFFRYLVNQREDQPDQVRWNAPGSNQVVHGNWAGHRKMKKAYQLCAEAIENNAKAHENWKTVFGDSFPALPQIALESAYIVYDKTSREIRKAENTEEYIERQYPVDIRSTVKIDYDISKEDATWRLLRIAKLLEVPRKRTLTFKIIETNVKPPFDVFWKVKNEGYEAIHRNKLRGKIYSSSAGKNEKSIREEPTEFKGSHWVECYIIKKGICVARNRIDVPIE